MSARFETRYSDPLALYRSIFDGGAIFNRHLRDATTVAAVRLH